MSTLTATPLVAPASFSWVFLIEYITCAILALFFLFYWNRIISTILAWLIRLYVWHAFRIYIDIGALQVSLLAGRVFFKNVRYHGDNETVFLQSGFVTWRYWLRRVKIAPVFEEQDAPFGTEDETALPLTDLPCRISAKVSGVEAFIYNRGPAYDWILENVKKRDKANLAAKKQAFAAKKTEKTSYRGEHQPKAEDAISNSHNSASSVQDDSQEEIDAKREAALPRPQTASTTEVEQDASLRRCQPPGILSLLPIHVECSNAAAVLGNENSKAIITVKIDSAAGEFSADKPSLPLDLFKIVMDFEVEKPVIQMRPNVDYKRPQLTEAIALKEVEHKADQTDDSDSALNSGGEADLSAVETPTKRRLSHRRLPNFSSLYRKLQRANLSSGSIANYLNAGQKAGDQLPNIHSDLPDPNRWLGLRRYLDEKYHDEHEEWDPVEYAKTTTIAEIDRVDFKFYWDIPGQVLARGDTSRLPGKHVRDDVNGDPPPQYGMELGVHGGQINYGPWADRHRQILQDIFFPASYVDAVPTSQLQPGQSRLNTVFTLQLTIEKALTLRIPFREASKDWRWKGRAKNMERQGDTAKAKSQRQKQSQQQSSGSSSTRPFAWFDISVGCDTTVSFRQDMFPMSTGFKNQLTVDATDVDISSSLNHARLWHTASIKMECDLSHPLAWNGLREWIFDMSIRDLDFFLLRDHTFLLMDLIDDWTRGPLADYYTFAPYRYILKVHFVNFKLWLNVNDANIVNRSDDLSDNEFVILYGAKLNSDLTIPLDRFRPAQNDIAFDVVAHDLGFELLMPTKNTISSFLKDKNVAVLPKVILHGSYSYWSSVEPGLTETLCMTIIGTGLNIYFYGFLGRMLAKVKENYFGDDLHFKTLDEYQNMAQKNFAHANADQPLTKANDLDVILDIKAEDANILLPCGLYEADEYVRLQVETTDIDLRVNNYYLEMLVTSSPIYFSYRDQKSHGSRLLPESSSTQMFIDGVSVFGHRLFGLPPVEPSYVSRWDVKAGIISGECSTHFLAKVAAAAQSLIMTFPDHENAMPLPHLAAVHDATFVRFECDSINLWFPSEHQAYLFQTARISGSFDDFADKMFSQRLEMYIPRLVLACADTRSRSRHGQLTASTADALAYVETALELKMVQRSAHFEREKQLQQEHIFVHDERTHRAQFLLDPAIKLHRTISTGTVNELEPTIDCPHLPTSMVSKSHSMKYPRPQHLRRRGSNSSIRSSLSSRRVRRSADSRAAKDRPVINSNAHVVQTTAHQSTQNNSRHRGMLPSSMVFVSSYQWPFMPLNGMRLSLEDVPAMDHGAEFPSHLHLLDSDLVFDPSQNDDAMHTSLVINATPGVTAYARPEAVRAIADLLDDINPQSPAAVLDRYQFVTLTQVLANLHKKHGNNTILDISIRLPSIHVRFDNRDEDEQTRGHSSDRFDFFVSNTSVLVRDKILPERIHEEDSTSVHASMGSVLLSAREESARLNCDSAALAFKIDDVLFWLVDGDKTVVHASFNMLSTSLISKEVGYVARLIYRTTLLADNLGAKFADVVQKHQKRMQCLIYEISRHGNEVSDPAFLTSMSYVIRSVQDHIRNTDSWKIVSRLRHIWTKLSVAEKAAVSQKCSSKNPTVPDDSKSYVIAELDKWRSWDTVNVKSSFAVRVLYGDVAPLEGMRDRATIPVGVTVRGYGMKFMVDPGPSQSEFGITGLALNVSITPPPPDSAAKLFSDAINNRSTVIQVATKSIYLQLDWAICNLIEQMLELFEHAELGQLPGSSKKQPEPVQDVSAQEIFQVVLSSENLSLHFKTSSVALASSIERCVISCSGQGWAGESTSFDVHSISNAKRSWVEVQAHDTTLLLHQVIEPTLCIDLRHQESPQKSLNHLQIAGDSNEILVDVREELHGLLEVSHKIICNEVAYVDQLVKRYSPLQEQDHEKHNAKRPGSTALTIQLALFLKQYRIKIQLLHDLAYVTAGDTVRLSVGPDHRSAQCHRIDFDLKSQMHELRKVKSPTHTSSASFCLPPINGTVRMLPTCSAITASGNVSMETIEIDGSAMYHMLGLISTPQMESAISAIKADGLTVMQSVRSLTSKPSNVRVRDRSQPSKALIFDGHVTLAGLNIGVGIREATKDPAASRLAFHMGTVQFRAANRSPREGSALPFPEMRLWLRQMGISVLQRNSDGKYVECGKAIFGAIFTCDVEQAAPGVFRRNLKLTANGPVVTVTESTAPAAVTILSHLQDRLKDLDLSMERKYMRRLKNANPAKAFRSTQFQASSTANLSDPIDSIQFQSNFSFSLRRFEICYFIKESVLQSATPQNQAKLLFTLEEVILETRSEKAAMLKVERLQLQLCEQGADHFARSSNSALLPEVKFTVRHAKTQTERRFRILAAGQALDLQLEPRFVMPLHNLEQSIARSSKESKVAMARLRSTPSASGAMPDGRIFGDRKIGSVVLEASFAGAVIILQNHLGENSRKSGVAGRDRAQNYGRYGQFVDEDRNTQAVLKAPGVKVKADFHDDGSGYSTLKVETIVEPSSNTLQPSVVPLLLKVADGIQKTMESSPSKSSEPSPEAVQIQSSQLASRYIDQEAIISADPRAILGHTKLDIGFRVCRQTFALSCQPIAKVAARATIDDIYILVNTVESNENGNFFSVSATAKGLSASLQHVYSRDSTFHVNIESIILSMMNSKHLNGVSGISAILTINPSTAQVNAKQLQDLLLFREIWYPHELRRETPASAVATPGSDAQDYFVQRYREIAAATPFNWNATLSIAQLSLELDLGQAIGRTKFDITNLWASSKKASSSQQTLCVGVDYVSADCTGRLSGFVKLDKVKVRTSIAWPKESLGDRQRPLIQGSIGFEGISVKAAFDYQAFAIVDIKAFEFIMYNVRNNSSGSEDRLVAILDGDHVCAYCVSSSAALSVALYQAFERLVQEKQASYDQALRDVERFLRRRSVLSDDVESIKRPQPSVAQHEESPRPAGTKANLPLKLHNDVVVTLRSIDVGAFPGSFSDKQLVRLRASDLQARFAVVLENGKIHSGLGLTLGHVSAALSEIPFTVTPKKLGEITVEDVVKNAQSSRGGIILRVPKVLATMQTWQQTESYTIDYVFKSSFEGKIDVGWNYSRISFIRGMWSAHSQALASRLGKPLPESALKISGVPQAGSPELDNVGGSTLQGSSSPQAQQKITAVVSLPQSKYLYRPLEPPVIVTPQLRDMGEATPPLEWIGLHRDRLPNVTHQILIVSLLRVAREVEDAYTSILGSAN